MKKYISLSALILSTLAILYFNWEWVTTYQDLAGGLLTAGILVVALIFTLLTLESMRHDRATSIAMTMREYYESGVIFEGRKVSLKILNWQEKHAIENEAENFVKNIEFYKSEYPEEFMRLVSIPGFFDLIGWLVRSSCCNAKAIDEQLDWKRHYELWKPYIENIQRTREEGKQTKAKYILGIKSTDMYGNFVWLANKLSKSSRTI